MKIGIIQSRGLGDLLIALPIAKHYVDEGHKIYWPICEEFWPSVRETAPWVQWIPMVTDARGEFFYDEPMKRLKNFKCDEIICLYQALNSQKQLSQVPYFQIQKFDEFKYTKTGVPFLKKWTLGECITRNRDREQKLYDKLVSNENYAVIHTEGSDFTCTPDLSSIPKDWQQINITPVTECVFDWLKILEGAQALILVDSVFSNMVDQLKIDTDKYLIPRSHIHLTPVLGTDWTILEAPPGSLASKTIFSPG